VTGRIAIVGLGPGGTDLITPQTRVALGESAHVRLRTRRHPAAELTGTAASFDDVYEQADRFADVYREIADRLLAEASDIDEELVYAVPGSPLVLERTVDLLRGAASEGRVELRILPAMSFLDVAWAELQIDPVEAGVRLIDGHTFAVSAAGQTGPLLVAHCHALHVLSDIKLAVDDPPPRVTVLQRLGLPDQRIFDVAWADLDREVDADHLTSIYIAQMGVPVATEFVKFDELVRELREKCPWDREQTHASLRRHLLEETHEVLEALDARGLIDDDEPDADLDDHLAEELGDLLFQIFFHARLAAERGAFTVADVARGVHDKLVYRHPHVFADASAESSDQVLSSWEELKKQEKGRQSAMDGIASTLPSLMLALKMQKRAASAGFDFEGGPEVAFADVESELAEVRNDPCEHEVGDLLFAAVQVARRLSVDPEMALRSASQRFERRFRVVEELAGGGDEIRLADISQLESWWALAKQRTAEA